jgi:hypothetical protein
VKIDVEEVRGSVFVADDVTVPDLLGKGISHE